VNRTVACDCNETARLHCGIYLRIEFCDIRGIGVHNPVEVYEEQYSNRFAGAGIFGANYLLPASSRVAHREDPLSLCSAFATADHLLLDFRTGASCSMASRTPGIVFTP